MRLIPFEEEISRERIEWLLHELQSDYGRGLVFIDSPGGAFEFFSQLAPPLARSGFVSVGSRVASAAIVLQLLGRERLATPDATFFFHEVRTIVEPGGEFSIYDLERALDMEREMKERWSNSEREFVERWHDQQASAQSWMLSFIARQTGLPSGRFVDLMRNEVTLSAQEAQRYGIVHRIVTEDELDGLCGS